MKKWMFFSLMLFSLYAESPGLGAVRSSEAVKRWEDYFFVTTGGTVLLGGLVSLFFYGLNGPNVNVPSATSH